MAWSSVDFVISRSVLGGVRTLSLLFPARMAAETGKCSTGIAEWTSSECEPSTVCHQAIWMLRRRIASPLIIIKIALYWHCYCSGFISFNPYNCPCRRNFCDPHFTERETEIQRLITGTSVTWLVNSDPQFKVRPADRRVLVLSNQKSVPDGGEEGWWLGMCVCKWASVCSVKSRNQGLGPLPWSHSWLWLKDVEESSPCSSQFHVSLYPVLMRVAFETSGEMIDKVISGVDTND